MSQLSELYLEAHVTIAPVFGKERERCEIIARSCGFKLAHLIMLKDIGLDKPSQRDTFMTGHGKNIDEIATRTKEVVRSLRSYGFKVWRYKIESCVIDSRQTGDIWDMLAKDRPELPLIACDGCYR